MHEDDFISKIDTVWNYKPALMVVMAFIAAFFVWASIAEIDQQVIATGRVIPAGKARSIQHLEGGIINGIEIKEGQLVEEGDVLFYVGNQKAQSDLQEAKIVRDALFLREQRLQAEQAGADEVDFEPAYAKKFPNIVQTERDLFEARKQAFAEQISGLQKQLRQKELKLDDLYTRINDLGEELDVIEEQLAIKQKLLNSGAISRSVYLETESRARNFETRINAAKKEVPITKSELQEVYSNIEEERQNNNAEIIEDLKDVRLDISTMTERIKALQDEVSRTAIRSPIKGIVNKLYINTIGGVISPGQTLADLVPLEETLVIEGRVATNDRGKIYSGLIVNAKIRAYDYTVYGGMTGELTQISADSFIEKDGSEYYRIRVTLTTSQLSADKPIYPGMTADLNILAGKTTVLSAILKPYKRIRDTAFTDI